MLPSRGSALAAAALATPSTICLSYPAAILQSALASPSGRTSRRRRQLLLSRTLRHRRPRSHSAQTRAARASNVSSMLANGRLALALRLTPPPQRERMLSRFAPSTNTALRTSLQRPRRGLERERHLSARFRDLSALANLTCQSAALPARALAESSSKRRSVRRSSRSVAPTGRWPLEQARASSSA